MLSQTAVHSLTSQCNQHEGSLAPACHRRVEKSVMREGSPSMSDFRSRLTKPKRTKELMCRLKFWRKVSAADMKQSE